MPRRKEPLTWYETAKLGALKTIEKIPGIGTAVSGARKAMATEPGRLFAKTVASTALPVVGGAAADIASAEAKRIRELEKKKKESIRSRMESILAHLES